MKSENANTISEKLLLAVKQQEPVNDLVNELEHFQFTQLQEELNTDERKKAFWINIYNAYFQILRISKNLVKPKVYKEKEIVIAGKYFSLDDIEHGILRRFRYKYSLGYLPNMFAPEFIKKLIVKTIDYRIHFALNCGAKSCPPIAFYSVDRINEQLDTATLAFLEIDTEIDTENKKIYVTSLFKWFLKDFGGLNGIRIILNKQLNVNTKGYKIKFKVYSWEEQLHNFSE